MTILTIMRGLPASGKTTWSNDVDAVRVSRDSIRQTVAPGFFLLNEDQEQVVTKVEEQTVRLWLKAGFDVVVDDMNLRSKYVKRWISIANQCGADYTIIDLTNQSLEDCLERNEARGLKVPQDLITGLHDRYVKGKPYPLPYTEALDSQRETYERPQGVYIKAFLVDIDGTLANHEGIRNPYDTTRYSQDVVHEDIRTVIYALVNRGYYPIFCSGRSDEFRAVTASWIHRATNLYDFGLLMRPKDDHREDSEVKYDLFDQYVRHAYDVLLVLDDRQRVVDMWRAIGLRCLQVAPGDF